RLATETCEQRATDTRLGLDEYLCSELRRSFEGVRQMRRHEGGCIRQPVVLAGLEANGALEGKADLHGVMRVESDIAARLADPQAAALPAMDAPARGGLRAVHQVQS